MTFEQSVILERVEVLSRLSLSPDARQSDKEIILTIICELTDKIEDIRKKRITKLN